MECAWRTIQGDPRVALAVDLDTMGLCVAAQVPPARRYVLPRMRYVLR
jgi:hypothetical protein